jgi:hypothetical protein
LHADQALQTPLTQVRVCVPQRPQACVGRPSHDATIPPPLEGSLTGVGLDDQSPHTGSNSVFGRQLVVMTQAPPFAAALVHAPCGSFSSVPSIVKSVPESRGTQHADAPQTPPPDPIANSSATLTFEGSTPVGNASVQLAGSTFTGWEEPKHVTTSKQPPATPASPDTLPPSLGS